MVTWLGQVSHHLLFDVVDVGAKGLALHDHDRVVYFSVVAVVARGGRLVRSEVGVGLIDHDAFQITRIHTRHSLTPVPIIINLSKRRLRELSQKVVLLIPQYD